VASIQQPAQFFIVFGFGAKDGVDLAVKNCRRSILVANLPK
tara:strand:+ start:66154 stop:66276 length:123 start_codon:yes stop_codon:yes gene_type:complete